MHCTVLAPHEGVNPQYVSSVFRASTNLGKRQFTSPPSTPLKQFNVFLKFDKKASPTAASIPPSYPFFRVGGGWVGVGRIARREVGRIAGGGAFFWLGGQEGGRGRKGEEGGGDKVTKWGGKGTEREGEEKV